MRLRREHGKTKKKEKNEPVLEKLARVLCIYSVKVDFNESDCMKKHSEHKDFTCAGMCSLPFLVIPQGRMTPVGGVRGDEERRGTHRA